MKIYTKKGDDGTTGLLYGGRVAKDGARPEAYGTVDELQACIGVARAECRAGGELDELLIGLERDLWVLMAEVATDPANHGKLTDGHHRVTAEMVTALEARIDDVGDPVRDAQGVRRPRPEPGRRRCSTSPAPSPAGPSAGSSRSATRRPRSCPTSTACRTCCGPLARWQEGGSLTARA